MPYIHKVISCEKKEKLSEMAVKESKLIYENHYLSKKERSVDTYI